MKKLMNFTLDPDDLGRYRNAEDLKHFYTSYGLDGLELMPVSNDMHSYITNDMILGVHLRCPADWMQRDRSELAAQYRKDLDFAQSCQADYVVFHITQVSDVESFTYQMQHTDAQVIDAACELIHTLLDHSCYTFDFLMENLWWPGLTLLDASMTRRLLDGIHYPKKGILLDTGHYLHTNHELCSQEEAIAYLGEMLDRHEDLLPYFKGIHLQQSLTGAYVKQILANPPALEEDPSKRFCQLFEHIFRLDLHQPFTHPEIADFVRRVNPDYLTFEYITRTRQEHAEYLRIGTAPF